MFNKNKKFYITTSIPYTNAPPHAGFALEIIQADVLARYRAQQGCDVFFLTGTDEHGQKTLKAAEAAGKEPLEFANEISGKFKELTEILNISNNDFIRTTDKERHLPAVYKLWQKMEEVGDIYKKKYKGHYCIGCEAFKTQKELVDGKCIVHQKETESVEEENYFFKLSKYLSEIKKIIEKDKIKIIPESKKNEVLSMIRQGLEDVSFSRAKEKYWGWSVPNDDSQNIYVWSEALSNYISAIGYKKETSQFKKFWPADIHCIGKDIVKFHCIFWPAMLLSVGLELPKSIFIHGFITVDGQKMSKSLGNVIDPFELVKKYGTDAVRYYLLREILPTEDGDFTYEKFEQRYNSDLAGGIGNLVARVLTMANKLTKNQKRTSSSYARAKTKNANQKLKKEIEKIKKGYKKHLENFKFNEALKVIWELVSWCDKYINKERPWEGKKNARQVVSDSLFALKNIADLLSPFLPETSEKIKKAVKSEQQTALFPRI
ncbi:MAG: methionyl-tRNA synthetase [Parcubacteria group bacterium Licking1014_1]|nr:MAG: methionyl-tRNA synthetase [Parcubacteria group bacterium Licking1014_1]